MILMDLYQRGIGIINKFPPVAPIEEAEEFLQSYCKEKGLKIIGREYCPLDHAHWNYLSDGTELDYCEE